MGSCLWSYHFHRDVLPHQALPSTAEGAVFLSGEHQSQLASGYSEQLFPDIDYLDDELLCLNVDFDDLYMVLSLAIWMFICYFVYKHESVIDVLTDSDTGPIDDGLDDGNVAQGLAATVRQLFEEEKIYLNPKLKLSDVARMVGTNRTYLSRFFNEENGQTFYDFVNNYRVEHATQLLRTSSYTVLEVAEKSGFNSVSTFRRAFVAAHKCSPNEYRAQM